MLNIVCFGNLWHGDDGLGIHVLHRLRGLRRLPPHVRLFDAGIAGPSAIDYFEDCSKALIIDAMRGYGQIGSVHRFRLADFDPPEQRRSMHEFGVDELATILPIVFEGRAMPEVVVIGAEIGEVRPFRGKLTPRLDAALDRVIRLIELEIVPPASGGAAWPREREQGARARKASDHWFSDNEIRDDLRFIRKERAPILL
jgi:hydrogenase maturation protease